MSTDPTSAAELEEVVARVLAADDTRAALEEACAARPADAELLRRTLESLKRFHMLEREDEDAPLATIGGFRLIEVLGKGGMGVVYRARDPELGRDVALKVLRPEYLHFEDSRERFRREVAAAARLRHPGIVSVFQAQEEGGVPFFTMELVEGASLAAKIAGLRGRPPASLRGTELLTATPDRASGSSTTSRRLADSWTDACVRVLRMIAEALDHAHQNGVYHRDIKPSNVLIDEHGRARLLDFGLARLDDAQQLTRSHAVLGSLPYLSKEQVEGRCSSYGPRQEVYSLGVTLYELLTLQPPYFGPTTEDTRRRIVAADPTPPRRINRAVSRDVETVCLTAMDPVPDRRYASVRELADDLDALLGRRPVRARPIGPVLRAWRAAGRHPTIAVGVALGVLLVVASVLAAVNAVSAREVERDARRALVDSNLRFVFQFVQGLRRIPGNTEVRAELLAGAAGQLEQFEDDPELDAARLRAIGDAHLALAGVLGDRNTSNVGETDLARERYAHVTDEIVPRLAALDPTNAAILHARASIPLASLHRVQGDHEGAIEILDAAARALQQHVVDRPDNVLEDEAETVFLLLQSQLASAAGSLGRHREALTAFEAVRDRLRRRAAARPDDVDAERKAAHAASNVARALYGLGEHERAAEEYETYIEVLERWLQQSPDDATRQFERVRGAVSYPEMLIRAGRLDEAIAECRRSLVLADAMIASDAQDVSLPELRLFSLYGLGWAFHERAETAIRSGADVASEAVRDDLHQARSWLSRVRDDAEELRRDGRLHSGMRLDRVAARLEDVERLLGDH